MTASRLHPARISAAILLIGVAVALLCLEGPFRDLEAELATALFGLVTPTLASPSSPVVWFGLGHAGAFGLDITPECSSALLIAPIALIGAAMLWSGRVRPPRVLLAVAAAAVALVIGNQVRLGFIAGLVGTLGIKSGYEWGHVVVGSLVSLVFAAGALGLMVWIVSSGRPAHEQP